MKFYKIGLCLVLSMSVLSSCAYIDGRKYQLNTPPEPTAPVKKSQKVISSGSLPSSTNTTSNPSATATKMLAPITQ